MGSETKGRPVLLYDGTCNLCQGVVTFLRRRDRCGRLHFAPQQGKLGRKLLQDFDVSSGLDTVVLIERGKAFIKSAAVLQAMLLLPRPWPWLAAALRLLPTAWRDWLYDRVAHSRYRLFGRTDRCDLP